MCAIEREKIVQTSLERTLRIRVLHYLSLLLS